MKYNLIRETVTLREKIGNEKTQLVLDGDLIVSDIKPDIDTLLQKDYELYTELVEVVDSRINFSGKLVLKILYLCKGDTKAIHSIDYVIDIKDFLVVENISPDSDISFNMELLNIDYSLQNDRKLSYQAVINVSAHCNKNVFSDVIVDIDNLDDDQVKHGIIKINQFVGDINETINIKEEIHINTGSPNISELLQTNVHISNKDVRIINNNAHVTGNLEITFLYKGDALESLIEIVSHEIPFEKSFSFDEDDVSDTLHPEVFLDCHDKFISVIQDEDGEERCLSLESVISVHIKLTKEIQKRIVIDTYILNKKSNLSLKTLEFDKLISRNKSQCVVKEILTVSDIYPSMLQIIGAKSKCIIDDVTLLNNKILVEGVIDSNVLYIAEDDNKPLCTLKETIPFSQTIETKGAKEGMNINSSASVEHITFNLINDREVDLRITLGLNITVENPQNYRVIDNIEFEDFSDDELGSIASVTIYVVQPKDTLWDIAKKYNTTIQEILTVNDLDIDTNIDGDVENSNKLVPYSKLVIVKKIVL